MMLGVSQPLKDIRPRAEEKARRKAEELREQQSGDTVRPPGTGFETERARAKQALRDEVNAQTGQSVRKIAATSGPAVNDDRILRVAAYCRVSTDDIDQVISIECFFYAAANQFFDLSLDYFLVNLYNLFRHGLHSPFRMVCRDFILTESANEPHPIC